MFGIKYSSLFTSRWMALLWCILICLTAIQFVGAAPGGSANADTSGNSSASADGATDATGMPVTQDDVRALRNAFEN